MKPLSFFLILIGVALLNLSCNKQLSAGKEQYAECGCGADCKCSCTPGGACKCVEANGKCECSRSST